MSTRFGVSNVKTDNNKTLLELVKDKLRLSEDDYEIGFFESDRYAAGQYVAQVAYWNEYGSHHPGGAVILGKGNKKVKLYIPPHDVPPRPFLSTAAKRWGNKAIDVVIKAIASGTSEQKALQLGAIFLRDKIVEEIDSFEVPANSPLTVMLKGSSHPLIDTGKMRRSVRYKKIEGRK